LLKCALALATAVFVLAGATKAHAQYEWCLTDVTFTTNLIQDPIGGAAGGLQWNSTASPGTSSFYEDGVSDMELDVTNVWAQSELKDDEPIYAYTTNSVSASVEFDVSGVFVWSGPYGEAPTMDFGMEVSFDVELYNIGFWYYDGNSYVYDALSSAYGSYSGEAPFYSYFYSANGAEVSLDNFTVTEGTEYQTSGGVGPNYAYFSVFVANFYTALPAGSSPLYVEGVLGVATEGILGANSGGYGYLSDQGTITEGYIKISLFDHDD